MSRLLILAVAAAGLALSGVHVPAHAQPLEPITVTKIDAADNIRETTIDLNVPVSPAFTVLGVTPETVVHPTSPRRLAAGILQGLDPNGNLQTGLALDSAPYLLFAGDEVSLQDYERYPVRLAARTEFSFATTKGLGDDDDSVRVALGLRLTPWDRGDPRRDGTLLKCFADNPAKQAADQAMDRLAVIAATDPGNLDTAREPLVAALEQKAGRHFKQCRDDAAKRNWNASAWSLGIAPTWTSESNNIGGLDWSGAASWTTLGYGFEGIPVLEDMSQVLFHARYRLGEMAPDPDQPGRLFEQDTLILAAKGRIGMPSLGTRKNGSPDFLLHFETAYIMEQKHGRSDDRLFQYTAGIEYRLTDDLYLTFSVGSQDGRNSGDEAFATANIKFGSSAQPTK